MKSDVTLENIKQTKTKKNMPFKKSKLYLGLKLVFQNYLTSYPFFFTFTSTVLLFLHNFRLKFCKVL